jgi:general stress protein YciG
MEIVSMAGTHESGKRAAATNLNLYGPGFYRDIGKLGGAKSRTGGFYANREAASKWGRIGGTISRKEGQPKLNKSQVRDIKRRLLEEQSQMQTQRLSQKYGAKRPW